MNSPEGGAGERQTGLNMAKKRVLLIEAIWAAALCAQPCLV
jgi:hypothetical protein